jgi:hypothetical protein
MGSGAAGDCHQGLLMLIAEPGAQARRKPPSGTAPRLPALQHRNHRTHAIEVALMKAGRVRLRADRGRDAPVQKTLHPVSHPGCEKQLTSSTATGIRFFRGLALPRPRAMRYGVAKGLRALAVAGNLQSRASTGQRTSMAPSRGLRRWASGAICVLRATVRGEPTSCALLATQP